MKRLGLVLTAAVLTACHPRAERAAESPVVWPADSVLTDIPGATAAGDLNFSIPAAATRLSDGTVVIGDLHGGAVRYFDPAGRQVASFGRFGEGPGEFAQVYWLGQCAHDTVFVLDSRLNRLTVLDRRGEIIRQELLPANQHRTPPVFLACAPGGPWGALRIPLGGDPSPRNTAPYPRAPLDLLDSRGQIAHEAGDVEYGQVQVLGRLTKLASAPGLLYVGTAESAAVDVYDSTGRHLGVVGVGRMNREVTQALWERATDERLWQLPLPDDRAALRDRMLALPRPEYLPPYSALAADPKGTVWANLSFPGDTTTRLRGVRQDGTPVADIVIHTGMSVLEVGMDYVLGIEEDPSGELHVVVRYVDRSHPT